MRWSDTPEATIPDHSPCPRTERASRTIRYLPAKSRRHCRKVPGAMLRTRQTPRQAHRQALGEIRLVPGVATEVAAPPGAPDPNLIASAFGRIDPKTSRSRLARHSIRKSSAEAVVCDLNSPLFLPSWHPKQKIEDEAAASGASGRWGLDPGQFPVIPESSMMLQSTMAHKGSSWRSR